MGTERAQDLHAFKSFVEQQLTDDPVPTVGEVIARWGARNQTDAELTDMAHAVKESLAHVDAAASGTPAPEVVAEIRKKDGLTSDARTLQRNPEEWIKRLHGLVGSQPIRPNAMNDSRESIYAGRVR